MATPPQSTPIVPWGTTQPALNNPVELTKRQDQSIEFELRTAAKNPGRLELDKTFCIEAKSGKRRNEVRRLRRSSSQASSDARPRFHSALQRYWAVSGSLVPNPAARSKKVQAVGGHSQASACHLRPAGKQGIRPRATRVPEPCSDLQLLCPRCGQSPPPATRPRFMVIIFRSSRFSWQFSS